VQGTVLLLSQRRIADIVAFCVGYEFVAAMHEVRRLQPPKSGEMTMMSAGWPPRPMRARLASSPISAAGSSCFG
jgi:hypothetical protein